MIVVESRFEDLQNSPDLWEPNLEAAAPSSSEAFFPV